MLVVVGGKGGGKGNAQEVGCGSADEADADEQGESEHSIEFGGLGGAAADHLGGASVGCAGVRRGTEKRRTMTKKEGRLGRRTLLLMHC